MKVIACLTALPMMLAVMCAGMYLDQERLMEKHKDWIERENAV